jgi:hypothetical protein
MKEVLDAIIDETQSGFMRNRHISNNVRLVLDILHYSDLITEDSFILFLDFYKAFDTETWLWGFFSVRLLRLSIHVVTALSNWNMEPHLNFS